jgi:hypothetical protein
MKAAVNLAGGVSRVKAASRESPSTTSVTNYRVCSSNPGELFQPFLDSACYHQRLTVLVTV